jgi:multidrug transporter EmrE-like cation transporter
MGWVYLLLAGFFEVGFTTSMRYIDASLKAGPIAIFLVFATASFGLLVAAMQSIPLGTAYAVWTGIGAAGTVIVGILFYQEPATALRIALLVVIIAAIIGLKLASPT